MQSSRQAAVRAGLVWAIALLLVVAVVGALVLHGDVRALVVDGLGLVAVWISVGVCWLAASRVGFRRAEVPLAAAAVTSFAAGLTYYGAVVAGGGPVPLVSPADVPSLLFYPLMLTALVVAVRHHSRELASSSSVWLDCAVASLGVTSVLAVLLNPVLVSALRSSSWMGTFVAIAYPVLDLLLVAAVAGIAGLQGLRMESRWALLAVGLMCFAGADIVLALQRLEGTFVAGTVLDAGWGIGLALIAIWVDGVARHDGRRTQERRPTLTAALAVSSVATLAGLGVLVVGTQGRVSPLAVALAVVTLVAATARSQLAFSLLARMADLRRLAATTDELTGLPNRRGLYAEGRKRLREPQRRRQALLMLDLNKFKEVNDSLGHHTGDLLLVQVGARLRENLRADDVLARLGGDEFAILLEDVDRDEAAEIAVKVCTVLVEPFALADVALRTSVSVGIALFPDDGADLGALLRKADIAMYRAKASGHGHHVYCSADDADAATRLQMVQELRSALTDDQIVLHYQPKIDLDTGDFQAVEALVRWNHPTRGLLYPDAFLDLAEESGLMPTLTRVVLAQALDQVTTWQAQGQQLTVAVNLSPSSLDDADLPRQVASMLSVRNLPPGTLQLEITEEFLMADLNRARAFLARLRNSGVQISVDGFGTNYSYLRDLAIDEVKLDRSFIFPMADDARAAAMVASTIDLAHSLGLRMVAEGVETKLDYTELARLGCDQAQGYYMSRPVPAAELNGWLSSRHPADQPADTPQPPYSATLR